LKGVIIVALSLAKGQKVDLTKTNPGLTRVVVGLGWDTNKYDGGADFDLDASVFLIDSTGKCTSEKDFIFYNQLEGGNGSVLHTGDNRTGEGEGDDEQVKVNLVNVPANIEKITFVITIHDAEARSQNFGQVSNAFCRIVNEDNNQEIIRYDLGEDFSVETAIIVGEIYRHNGEWKFSAIGSGYQGGLARIASDFGLSV
jgi:tellurium resistance protein TerD